LARRLSIVLSWRSGFRKSFKVAPGVRLNVSRQSVGVGVGPAWSDGQRLEQRRAAGVTRLAHLFWRKHL
jgi:hypothetical protein